MKRVLVDQGSGVEIMYLDLYKGLNLKPKYLEKYKSPLFGFDGRMVIPRGRIRLPVQARDEEVQVNFIMVEAYEGKSGFVSHTKLIAEATFMVLFHS